MSKSISLKQLAEKRYDIVPGLPPEYLRSFGELEDAFDCVFYGESGDGKTNMVIQFVALLIQLIDCRAEYISYEEGHGKTMRDALIKRHDLLEKIGARLILTDHMEYEELKSKMGKKHSPKIWIIDSVQASGLTYAQIKELKRLYVLSRKKKIIIFISWAEGKNVVGAVARDTVFYSNVKVRMYKYVCFLRSRFGGNLPFIAWEKGAKDNRTPEEWENLQRRIKGLPPRSRAAQRKRAAPKKEKAPEAEQNVEEIEVE